MVLSFTLVFLQCTIVRETHFIILFYYMAKGPLLVACKMSNSEAKQGHQKDFELITQRKSFCLKTTAFKMLKMLGVQCVTWL